MTKQVKEVIHQPLTSINTTISQKQLLNDLHYRQSKQIIQHLLDKGLISADQFQKIDQLKSSPFHHYIVLNVLLHQRSRANIPH